ncbi:MAG: alpha/beta fold hydrolase [Clostridia bacterium]|nr:alpha/beta fold hydrolase [Clostridia bacterium]
MRKLALCMLVLLLSLCSPAFAETLEIAFPSRGVMVPATLTLPDNVPGPSPIVLMAHGHGGSRDEKHGFGAIADALAKRGVGSIRMDFAGCGESSEDFAANCLTSMKQDMLSAMDYARTALDAPAVGLFGYSMGGRVVLELLAEGFPAHAAAILAPANDTADLIETTFEDFDAMYEAAKVSGFYPYWEKELLSPAWFEDLMRYDDPASCAAGVYDGPALVIWAQDDQVVRPQVCAHVADVLGAEVFDATGKGHIYGFWLDEDPLRERIAAAVSGFFERHFPAVQTGY